MMMAFSCLVYIPAPCLPGRLQTLVQGANGRCCVVNEGVGGALCLLRGSEGELGEVC